MKLEKLGDVFKITSGGTPLTSQHEYYANGDIPWVKTGDLKVRHLIDIPDKITKLGLENSSAKIFPVNTVLIAMYGATIGNCSILKKEAATNQACAALLPTEKVNEEYLYFYLSSIKQDFINKGVGGGQPNISATILKGTKFPLLELDDQRRIAKVLSQCEVLIQKRKESIDLLDELLKSTFLEMFGDEFKKTNEWDTRLIDVAPSIDSGWSPVCESFSRKSDDQWAVLKLSCVTKKNFDPTKNKACFPDTIIKKAIIPQRGDLLFSRKNTYELVGATAYVFDNFQNLILPDTIFKINYNPQKVNGIFLWYLLNDESFSKRVRELANGAAGSMPNISQSKLLNLTIPCPSMSLQNKFSESVEKALTIKAKFLFSLKELENLYGSISQRAFNGELDLSKVDISNMEDSKKKDFKEVKVELEPMVEDFGAGKYKIKENGVKIEEIIKNDFAETTFSFKDLENAISKRGINLPYENIKEFVFQILEGKNALLEQIFDEVEKKIVFNVKP